MKIASIYKIKNTINGKQYVGVTAGTVESRWKDHLTEAKHKVNNSLLHRAIRKYGEQSFLVETIYQSWEPKDCWIRMEPYFIKYFDTYCGNKHGYNLSYGGEGCGIGRKHSPESIAKMKGLHAGRKNGMFGKKPANYGITMPDAVRQKLKQVWQNHPELKEKNSQRMRQNNPMHMPDVVQRVVETIKRTGALAGGNNGRACPCLYNGVKYATISEAAKALGVTHATAKNRCTLI